MKQILSPTADGVYKELPYPARPHYNSSGYINWGYYAKDTYVFPNPTRSGHITNVRVSFYGYSTPEHPAQLGKTVLYSPSGIVYGSAVYLNGATYTTDYALNPWTGVAWTWDEIDALEAGFSLHGTDESSPGAWGTTSRLIITSASDGGQVRIIGMMM